MSVHVGQTADAQLLDKQWQHTWQGPITWKAHERYVLTLQRVP